MLLQTQRRLLATSLAAIPSRATPLLVSQRFVPSLTIGRAASSLATAASASAAAAKSGAAAVSAGESKEETIKIREINVYRRVEEGTKRCEVIRFNGYVPGVVYGKTRNERILVTVKAKDIEKELRSMKESFQNTLYYVNLHDKEPTEEGSTKKQEKPVQRFLVLPRDLSLHPVTDEALCCNFLKYNPKEGAKVKIPYQFIEGEQSPGLKRGAFLNRISYDVLCKVTGMNIPSHIFVSTKGKDVGSRVRWSQIPLPPNVRLAGTYVNPNAEDFTVATIKGKRETKQSREEAAAAAANASTATPAAASTPAKAGEGAAKSS